MLSIFVEIKIVTPMSCVSDTGAARKESLHRPEHSGGERGKHVPLRELDRLGSTIASITAVQYMDTTTIKWNHHYQDHHSSYIIFIISCPPHHRHDHRHHCHYRQENLTNVDSLAILGSSFKYEVVNSAVRNPGVVHLFKTRQHR